MSDAGLRIGLAALLTLGLAACETTPEPPRIPAGVTGGVAVGASASAPVAAPAPAAQPAANQGDLPSVADQGIYGGLAGGEQGLWIDG